MHPNIVSMTRCVDWYLPPAIVVVCPSTLVWSAICFALSGLCDLVRFATQGGTTARGTRGCLPWADMLCPFRAGDWGLARWHGRFPLRINHSSRKRRNKTRRIGSGCIQLTRATLAHPRVRVPFGLGRPPVAVRVVGETDLVAGATQLACDLIHHTSKLAGVSQRLSHILGY